MLERFKPRAEDQVVVKEKPLRTTVKAIFERLNCPPEDAEVAADALLSSDLRGVESHGVSNMLREYVRGYMDGQINPRPQIKVLRETPSTATIDADRGVGVITGPRCMQIAIQKAEQVGMGVVTAQNGGHLGMLAYHAMLALPHDMIGVCMGSATYGASVLPTWAREPRMGTNPIAIAVPAGKEAPFVFDVATSAVAGNKITLAKRVGALMEPGWVSDEQGNPIMEEAMLPQKYFGLPLGGTRELGSHKGYGLSVMVGIMSSVLSGAGLYPKTPRPPGHGAGYYNHYFAAYKIDAFTPVDQFKEQMDDYLRTLRTTPPAPGHERVFYAGLPEAEDERERRAHGIALHKEVIQWFRDICGELSIPFILV
ncbi:MAG: Ldh family oxidoreductase [Chloroflexi bacterium]|nr:Ldh family oxidoreductase [Chloroflexota bacterium]